MKGHSHTINNYTNMKKYIHREEIRKQRKNTIAVAVTLLSLFPLPKPGVTIGIIAHAQKHSNVVTAGSF